jgi:hypothetical protein
MKRGYVAVQFSFSPKGLGTFAGLYSTQDRFHMNVGHMKLELLDCVEFGLCATGPFAGTIRTILKNLLDVDGRYVL